MNRQKKKIILAISGDLAAGKNEMTSYIKRKHSGYAYRSSEFLRDILQRMDLPETRENMQKLSTVVRKDFGEDIISHVAAYDLRKVKNKIIAINGVRRFSDLDCLRKYSRVNLIYIKSEFENRFERIKKRLENKDDKTKTLVNFKKDHKREAERQVISLQKKADYIVENNGTLKDFYSKIDEIIKVIDKKNDKQGN